jgi:excisionase family DNA binding protein
VSHFTTGKLAVRLGVQEHHIRELARRGTIPFVTAGKYRVFSEADVPVISRALIAAGYLKAPTAEAAGVT